MCVKTVDFATVEIGFWHVEVDGLIVRFNRVGYVNNFFKGTEGDFLSVDFRFECAVVFVAEVEVVICLGFISKRHI